MGPPWSLLGASLEPHWSHLAFSPPKPSEIRVLLLQQPILQLPSPIWTSQVARNGSVILEEWGLLSLYRAVTDEEKYQYEGLQTLYEARDPSKRLEN